MFDPALDALFSPAAVAQLVPAPESALFLRARVAPPLLELLAARPALRLTCEQTFRPFATDLERAGLVLGDNVSTGHDAVFVLPGRQRQEARATLVEAVRRCAPHGLVMASVSNNEGARSLEGDLEALTGNVETLSKNKCRVFWSRLARARVDETLAAQWQEDAAPRLVCEGRFTSRPGVFAWDRIDAGSALLAEHLPIDLAGAGADLGAGFGYLSHEVLTRCAGVTALDLYEAEGRALELARLNVTSSLPLRFLWHDVTQGLSARYDFVVTNPPFHTGHSDEPDLGRAFIAAAAAALKPSGRLLLVANRHLPYEASLQQLFGRVDKRVETGAFKVIEARKSL